MAECRICKSNYEPFISFGKMPIANGFLHAKEFKDEYFFDLKAGFCPECKMVQIIDQPDEKMMFHENYAFFSSTSTRMAQHFKEFAQIVMSGYIKSSDPFVLEIGSNDGIMLQHFAKAGIRHLGVEPSANVAAEARKKGINTISEFFDEKLAEKIIKDNGQADAVFAANVMCHIPYLHSVAAGIKMLLKPDGYLMYEDPYLGDIVKKTSYDQIYDEHAFYFFVGSVSYLFEQHGMEVVDVEPQHTHGGSMRYIICHKGKRDRSQRLKEQMRIEKELKLEDPATYQKLAKNIESSREKLVSLLKEIKKNGKRVVGYAATSKSTTVLNYCSIGPELVEFISDTTPIKQGKFSPGMHIPVKPYEEFGKKFPDYALLFGWNHGEEIMAKEKNFIGSGGKWIVYVPEVKIA